MMKDGTTSHTEIRSDAARLFFGLVLATLAGWVDAVGFLSLGSFYLSFMSGNTTQIAVAAAGHRQAFLHGGAIILSFFTGAFVGTLFHEASGRFRAPVLLAGELALFGAAMRFTQTTPGLLALLPVAAAMGMQNTLRQMIGGADVGKTFVTGSLYSAGQSLARSLTGAAPRGEWLIFLGAWLAFASGATGGAFALRGAGLMANLAGLAAVLAFLGFVTLLDALDARADSQSGG